jgi:hypothetical protein
LGVGLIGEWLLGPKGKSTTAAPDSMPMLNSALRGQVIPVTFGTNRVPAQIVWTNKFTAIRQKSSGKGGAKGGGSGGGGSAKGGGSAGVGYLYYWDMIYNFGMMDRPSILTKGWLGSDRLDDLTINAITAGLGSVDTTLDPVKKSAHLSFTEAFYAPGYKTGDVNLDSWTYFTDTMHFDCAWPMTCYIGFNQLELGQSPIIPQLSVELTPLEGEVDVTPAYIIKQVLLSDIFGFQATQLFGFSITEDSIDAESYAAVHQYCLDQGFLFSVTYSNQDNLLTILNELTQLYGGFLTEQGGKIIFKVLGASGETFDATNRDDLVVENATPRDFIYSVGNGGMEGEDGNHYYLARTGVGVSEAIHIWRYEDGAEIATIDDTAIAAYGAGFSWLGTFNGGAHVTSNVFYPIGSSPFFFSVQKGTVVTGPGPFDNYPTFMIMRFKIDNTGTVVPDGQLEIRCDSNGGISGQASNGFCTATHYAHDDTSGIAYVLVEAGGYTEAEPAIFALPCQGSVSDQSEGAWRNNGYWNGVLGSAFFNLAGSRNHGFALPVTLVENGMDVPTMLLYIGPYEYAYMVGHTGTNAIWDEIVAMGDPYGVFHIEGASLTKIIDSSFFTDAGKRRDGSDDTSDQNCDYQTPQAFKVGDTTWLIMARGTNTAADNMLSPPGVAAEIILGMWDRDSDTVTVTQHEWIGLADAVGVGGVTEGHRYDALFRSVVWTLGTDHLWWYAEFGGMSNTLSFSTITGWLGDINHGGSSEPSKRTIDNSHLVVDAKGTPPVKITKAALEDGYNKIQFNYLDRAIEYKQNQVEAADEVDIDINGPRVKTYPARYVMTGSTAAIIATRALWSNLYARDQYTFMLGWKDADIRPGDVITLIDSFDPTLFAGVRARVTHRQETKRGKFTINATREFDYFINAKALFTTQASVDQGFAGLVEPATAPDFQTAYELPKEFQGSKAICYFGYNQGASCMGAQLYLSVDSGQNFVLTQDQQPFIVSGRFASSLEMRPKGYVESNVDFWVLPTPNFDPATPTFVQDYSQDDVTQAIRAAGAGVMIVGSEAVAVENLTLLGQNHYRAKYLYRGWGGSPISSHTSGEYFHNFGAGVFNHEISQDDIGTTLQYKIAPYNFAGHIYDISSIPAKSYTIKGLYWLPREQPNTKFFVNSALAWPASNPLTGPFIGVTSGGCDLNMGWSASANDEGFGAGGFGAGTFGHFTASDSVNYRVDVASKNGVKVSSFVVNTGYFSYTLNQNSTDFNGFGRDLVVTITPFTVKGDGPVADTRSISLNW